MLKRKKIIETLMKMPEQVSLDEVLDRIILLDKIETRLNKVKKEM